MPSNDDRIDSTESGPPLALSKQLELDRYIHVSHAARALAYAFSAAARATPPSSAHSGVGAEERDQPAPAAPGAQRLKGHGRCRFLRRAPVTPPHAAGAWSRIFRS